ncbi:tRNA 2-thiouridine synthesizing protein A [Methylopila capsulata]|uniref:tRNA 2-thiouridine synthesizing protein A n=1 Tax=Methylopila capsulata TaxID=61654 RepID=A0ABS2T3M0_9HYPH|nr:sulfurtransferase TusA family protein [Methylopila capsulata]MBM7850466.1 tRNA 2-thiouridine synthesizing protein A [Methylopila capsulata]
MSAPTTLDLRGLRCPLPVLRLRKALLGMPPGATVMALTDDPLATLDVPNFLRETGDDLLSSEPDGSGHRFVVRRGNETETTG